MAVNTVDKYGLPMGGTTAQRPVSGQLYEGKEYFDTDLQQLLVWNGSRWQSTGGSAVPSTVVAFGSNIASAIALSTGLTFVTAANGTKGCVLPASVPGISCVVKNDENANAILKVYPPVNSAINILSTNAAISMAANTCCEFRCYNATTWFSMPAVPS